MGPLLLVVLALALAGCGSAGREPEPPGRAGGSWERLPDPPLSARENAVAVSLGDRALIVGGSDADPCPPNAECAVPTEPPLRDGAVFDPRAGTWARIADAPVGLSFAFPAVVDGDLYLLAPGERGRPGAPAAFLRYRRGEDAWTRLRPPPGASRRSIVGAGDRVVAYAESDEWGTDPDVVFDAATGTWTELPDDPLPRTYGRVMAWSGRELVLFAAELVPNPGAREPSVVIAAAYDVERASWRRLPDSEILGGGARWFAHEDRLIFAALGSADGGEVGNWGRPYPNGGVLRAEPDRWLPLPDPPSGPDELSAGIVAGARADFWGRQGWVLDAAGGEWTEVPPLGADEQLLGGRSVTAAGRDLLAFGGARWDDRAGRGELLGEAWLWRLP